jgi:hypothetical protein
MTNYDNFNSFDLNECCDYFDCEKQANWKKINKFIVADGQDTGIVLEAQDSTVTRSVKQSTRHSTQASAMP